MMFKRDKSMFEQLIRRDVGQSPNIVSVPLTVGNYALLLLEVARLVYRKFCCWTLHIIH